MTTRLELSLLELETIPHPPYSPDLAPMDFAIFPQVKSQLKGRRFATLTELRGATQMILNQYDEDWYRSIYDKWVHRHRLCVQTGGNYFVKS